MRRLISAALGATVQSCCCTLLTWPLLHFCHAAGLSPSKSVSVAIPRLNEDGSTSAGEPDTYEFANANMFGSFLNNVGGWRAWHVA